MGVRKIILCADDYGIAPAVSCAIRELLERRRLSATSCMVVYPEFAKDGPLLRPFFNDADIGLHLTLTKDRSLRDLMAMAYLGLLNSEEIKKEILSQIEKFTSAVGRAPTYIDGHQHVHLFPGVREVVVDAAARLGAYVRVTTEPIGLNMVRRPSLIKSAFLSMSAQPLEALARKRCVVTNRGFRGARTFREKHSYRALFAKLIEGSNDGCLIMCHPGLVDDALTTRDPMTWPREEEYRYLASNDFSDDLAAAGIVLARLNSAIA